jgi:small-conductance mechanosensitive channel
MRRRAAADAPGAGRWLVGLGLVLALVTPSSLASAQAPAGSGQPPPAAASPAPPGDRELVEKVPSAQAATLAYTNRPIAVLRARVLADMPGDRVRAAANILDELVESGISGPVTSRDVGGVQIIRVGDRDVVTLVRADVDEIAGETIEREAADAVAALRVALDEAVELRTPTRLLQSALRVLVATLLFVTTVTVLNRVRKRLRRQAMAWTARTTTRLVPGKTTREPVLHVSRFAGGLVSVAGAAFTILMVYWWLTFSLRQFPYTRPWGESLRSHLLQFFGRIGTSVVEALPGLGVVLVIVVATRWLVRISNAFFLSIERGRAEVSWAHPESAGATRRLVALLLWLFALIVSYPYLPGSGSDAFKGVSVFIGLVVSLGSSGLVSQLMSGLTLTYARALTVGDYVRIGDAEGTVTAMNLLSVKLRTFQDEEVTVPNAVVVGLSTTNYTKLAAGGASLAIEVTIGYDTPWRQVRELLLLAAERTDGVRREPPPMVVKDALENSCVRYRLMVGLIEPATRVLMRDRLHASILDVFNEYGVQIMTPSYEGDPEAPKIVPRDRWFTAPAREQEQPNPPPAT